MKKFLLTFAFVLFAFTFYNITEADACVAPVERIETGEVELYEADDIIMQYIKLNVRPAESNYVITIEASVRNKNAEPATVMFGIPYYFYNGLSASSNVSVTMNGNNVPGITKVDAVRNPALGDSQAYYSSYYCWSIDIVADDVAYMYITLTAGTRRYENGTQSLDLPMNVLQYWADEGGVGEIIINSPLVDVYSYDRALIMAPTSVSGDGIAIWKNGLSDYTSSLQICHNIEDRVLAAFFGYTYTDGVKGEASRAFSSKRYADAIRIIDREGLAEFADFSFMKMICYEKLGYETEAYDILKKIYNNPNICFAADNRYDISEYVSKKMIFEYYSSFEGSEKEVLQAKRDALNSGINNLTSSKSSVFIMWAKNEMSMLDMILGSVPQQGNQGNTSIPGQGTMTQTPWVSKISEPVIITVGIVIVVVVIFCLTGLFTGTMKKSSKTHSLKKR